MDLPDLPLRPLVWLLRGLLWLGWEFLFETVGWWIGWCVCRTLSLGQFPRHALRDEDVPLHISLLVEVMGLAALSALLWALTGHWW